MYKAAMIAPTPFFSDRGCHVRILEEIKVLQKNGVDISLCTYHIGRDIPGIDIHRILNIPWYNKLTAGPSLHKFYLDPLLFIKCAKLCLKKRPDIIHAFLHEGALIGEFYKGFKRTPVIFDLQGGLTDELGAHNFIKQNGLVAGFFKALEGYIDRRADALMVCSEVVRDALIRDFDINPDRIYVIPDGVDLDFFRPVQDKMELRKRYGLPPDKKIVVYLGLLTRYQGLDLFLNVISCIKKTRRDIHFLIMGYPNVDYYKEKAEALGVYDMITFTGRIPYNDAPKYIGLGDVAVSLKLSKTEANGKLLDYMAVSLPVVVFDTPVNREILGPYGIYAEYGDVKSFAAELTALLDDSGRCKELGGLLRQRILENFSYDTIGKKIIEVYEKVI